MQANPNPDPDHDPYPNPTPDAQARSASSITSPAATHCKPCRYPLQPLPLALAVPLSAPQPLVLTPPTPLANKRTSRNQSTLGRKSPALSTSVV